MNSNKNKLRDPDRVLHMVEAARWVNEQAAALALADLLTNKMMQLALERQFEILGEAASHVSAITQQQRPDIDWRRIKNFRYFRVDYAQILYTAQQIIPGLLPLLEDLLTELDQQFGPGSSV